VLLTQSVDRSVDAVPFTLLDSVISDTLDAIRVVLSGNSSADYVDLAAVITNFTRDGISRYYFDLTYEDSQIEDTITCGTNAIFSTLFPQGELNEITMLAENLQQMGDIFQLVERVSEFCNVNVYFYMICKFFMYDYQGFINEIMHA